jgi:hypothetical protein
MMSIRSLFTSQIVLSKIRSKIYNEVFETGQILHSLHNNEKTLILCAVTVGASCLLIEYLHNYKIEKLKYTSYYKNVEKNIEIFLFVLMNILFRNVDNAI